MFVWTYFGHFGNVDYFLISHRLPIVRESINSGYEVHVAAQFTQQFRQLEELDIQFHPLTDKILHVDFYQLFDDKEISMNIPVKIEGSAPGVLNSGGVLSVNKRKLRVKSLPKNLPDFITVDISNLELGNKLYTSELQNESYTILHPDNTVVCQVRTSRASIKEEELVAEGEAESEVSSETPAKEGGEGETKSEE